MDISLSDTQVYQILSKNGIYPDIITYTELSQNLPFFSSLPFFMHERELWENMKEKPIVLCYLTSENYGHWTCLFKNKEGINFFDSYGLKPDDELFWNFPKSFKKKAKEDYPHLTRLLLSSSFLVHEKFGKNKRNLGKTRINYNPYQYQSKKRGVNTCGRHVIFRLCFSELSDIEYNRLIRTLCKRTALDPDELVVLLTT